MRRILLLSSAWFRAPLLLLAGMLVAGLAATPAAAQSESGGASLEGSVRGRDGQAVPNASVRIVATDTGYTRTVVTRSDGRFVAPLLPVGRYSIEATASGLGAGRRDNVLLRVGATQTVDIDLESVEVKPAAAGEQIEVSTEVGLIDQTEPAGSLTIDQGSISDLPARGRNFPDFVLLTPSVIQESDRSGLVISGQRSINSNVSIDGADYNDPLQGNQRGGNEGVFFFPEAAVEEFQVVRVGATASVGRTTAGFVNVVTKSGTNALHGEAFYFNRNRHLTSADAFGRSLDNQQNQFGGSIGGPIAADKAHFFVAAEQNLLRVPFVTDFQDQPAGVVVPADLQALEGEHHGTNNPTALFARVDVQLSQAHRLNVQYTYSRLRGENFNFDNPPIDQAEETNYLRTTQSHGGKLTLASMFGTSTLNELTAQFGTDDRLEQPNLSMPQIVIGGFGTIGGDAGRLRAFETTRYQVADNLNLLLEKHRLRFGFDLNVTPSRQKRESNIQGRYDFSSLADYEAVKINRYRQTLPAFDAADLLYDATQHELGLYAQDRASFGAVTVDLGLRWDGQWNPAPARSNPAVPETAKIPNDLSMWQPRLGVAWSPGGRGRSVLRATAGLYAARTPANLFQRIFTDNGISTVVVDSKVDKSVLSQLTFPNGLATVPPGVQVAPPQIFGFDQGFQNPRAKQFSAGFEQQIGSAVAASLSYVHISTDHLQRRLDRNLAPPTLDATGMPIFPKTRPDPTIGILSINESTAKSRYDAVVTSVQARSGRLNAQATYTLSWNKDDDSNERAFSREAALNPLDALLRVDLVEAGRAPQPHRQRSRGPALGAHVRCRPAVALGAALHRGDRSRHPERRQRHQRPGDHRRARVRAQRLPATRVLRPRHPAGQGHPLRQVQPRRPDRRAVQRDGREQQGLRQRRGEQLRHRAGAVRDRGAAAVRADHCALRRAAPAAAGRSLQLLSGAAAFVPPGTGGEPMRPGFSTAARPDGKGGGLLRAARARALALLGISALVLTAFAAAFAADVVVVVVNTSVPGTSVRRADLAAVFMKKALRWGDGSPASPVDQSGTSSVRKAFSENVLQMPVTAVLQYWQRQLLSSAAAARLPTVKASDDDVLAYVAKTKGSVGYVSAGATLPPDVKAVSVVD